MALASFQKAKQFGLKVQFRHLSCMLRLFYCNWSG